MSLLRFLFGGCKAFGHKYSNDGLPSQFHGLIFQCKYCGKQWPVSREVPAPPSDQSCNGGEKR